MENVKGMFRRLSEIGCFSRTLLASNKEALVYCGGPMSWVVMAPIKSTSGVSDLDLAHQSHSRCDPLPPTPSGPVSLVAR